MPLSEHEQRLLEQMERALYAEDPKFATALRGADLRAHYRRRIAVAGAGFVVGIALLIIGVVTPMVPLSVLGFVVMLGTAFFALTSWRSMPSAKEAAAAGAAGGNVRPLGGRSARRGKSSARFMERLEERWNRRREDNGR